MNKYVLVIDNNYGRNHYPLFTNLDIETINNQIRDLNDIAVIGHYSTFNYLGIELITIWSEYTEDYYKVYLLDHWFEVYHIEI